MKKKVQLISMLISSADADECFVVICDSVVSVSATSFICLFQPGVFIVAMGRRYKIIR